ncbi:MAG: ZIP family metal transporter, partial [Bacteroidota bacterium]
MENVIAYFKEIDPILAALYATLFTWGLTALGAALVFFFKKANRALLDGMLGFTGGVMVAASFWSLLAPGIA